ncbi:amidohydrolase family protein [uncultured Sphaerochaeta sp.]|uniref:metal-dependent hydrolase family protein n=1 Tax=uncultured Sphaerochaeta sp. TaxID=886478 RepID=UPI002A0A3FA7|nr:amidohydrolase family protein [uncultured Sphaerochaeta sp.]
MKYVITNCSMYNGQAESDLESAVNIYFVDGTISEITKEAKIQEGYTVIDGTSKYVIPGLINTHAHLFGTGKPSKSLGGGNSQKLLIGYIKTKLGQRTLHGMVRKSVRAALFSGCTTVRGVGDFFYSDIRIRDEVNAGTQIGPRLLVSGFAITTHDGHGAGTFAITGDTPQELQDQVMEVYRHHPDLIKICVTGGVMDAKVKGEPGIVRMNEQQTIAVCDKVHELGLRVASHTESQEGVKIALAGGVDTIEHGSELTDQMVADYKKRNVAFNCTLSPALPLCRLSPELTLLNDMAVFNSKVVFDNIVEGTKKALANGVLVGMGTDASCPFAMQYNMWRELCYFHSYIGTDNKQTIHIATEQNAKVLGIADQTGTLEIGKSADMLILDKNPLEDLKVLRNVSTVICQGKVYAHPVIKKNEKIEKILDTLLE